MKILIATDGTKYGDAAVEMLGKFRLGGSDHIKIISVVDLAMPLDATLHVDIACRCRFATNCACLRGFFRQPQRQSQIMAALALCLPEAPHLKPCTAYSGTRIPTGANGIFITMTIVACRPPILIATA